MNDLVKLGQVPEMPLHHLVGHELNILAPAVLGLGQSKLRNKLAALLHQFKLEMGCDPQIIRWYCASVVSIATDQGTEAGIFSVPDLNLSLHLRCEAAALDATCAVDSGVLYPLQEPVEPALPELEDATPAEEAQAALALVCRLFPNSLFIPGVKHLLDNILHDIWDSMSGKKEFMEQLHAFEYVLKQAPYRDKLRHLFFDGENAFDKTMSQLLRRWTPSLKSLRWHSVVDFIKSLLQIGPGLRKRWNLQKFVTSLPKEGHDELAEGRGSEGAGTYKRLDGAMRSNFFWAYCDLMLEVSRASDTLSRWSEACWFHQGSCTERSCGYKGCRAPELAAGAHKYLLDECQSSTNLKVASLLPNLSDSESKMLLADWHIAHARLKLEWEYKLHFWDLLPWKLCGLACPSLEIARTIARECQKMWQDMTPQQRSASHPMTRRFLDQTWSGKIEVKLDFQLVKENHNQTDQTVCVCCCAWSPQALKLR